MPTARASRPLAASQTGRNGSWTAEGQEQGHVESLEPQCEMRACGFLGIGGHQRDCAPIVLIVRFRSLVGAMADGSFAISTIPSALPADGDYDALCQALMASARGRWFLEEYAKRNRNADTGTVLDAIARVEAVVRCEQENRATQGMRIELLEMARTIAQTRADVAESKPDPQAAAETASNPATDIFAAAGRLQDVAWTMRERGLDMVMCDQIADLSMAILSASSLRNPNDGRAQMLGEVLRSLEGRIGAMLKAQAEPAPSDGSAGAENMQPVATAVGSFEPAPAAPPPLPNVAAGPEPADVSPAATPTTDEITRAKTPAAQIQLDPIPVKAWAEAAAPLAEPPAPPPPQPPPAPQPAQASAATVIEAELDDFLLAPMPMPGAPAPDEMSGAPAPVATTSDPLAALRAMSPEERIALFT